MPPKRRRRFQGLYYHSSPPKVMPNNGQASNQNGRKRRDNDDFSVKLSTIRIWMHEKEIGKLTRILWAGQGNRLCQQASNNARVKRFLAAVPHVMNAIKDLHQAVIDNNLETLQVKLEPPVPTALVTCKDSNGLNVIHKAAGLGHTKILEYLIGIWPEGVHETDITGKTPLHWAASAKNNMRCYTLLTQSGGDEDALDYKMKTPSYYRHKPHEIERAFLVYVPEAPRVSPDSVPDWEALLSDDNNDGADGDGGSKVSPCCSLIQLSKNHIWAKPFQKLDIKIPATNLNGRTEPDDSAETIFDLDTNDGTSANEEDDYSRLDPDPDPIVPPLNRDRSSSPGELDGDDNGDGDDDDDGNDENGIGEGDGSDIESVARAINTTNDDDDDVDDDGAADAAAASNDDAVGNTPGEGRKVDEPLDNNEGNNDNNQQDEIENEVIQNGSDRIELQEDNSTEKTEILNDIDAEDDNDVENTEEENNEMMSGGNVENGNDADEEADEDEDEEEEDEDVVATSKTTQLSNMNETKMELQTEDEQENGYTESPSSSLAIEGFIQGASEDFTVQSQTADYELNQDSGIQQIIAAGDMEKLAEIVLNGEGGRLLGLKTQEPEIQAFLNNVPSYMEKIRRVHEAARDGSLLALQQALDRRKFAVAKDDVSPNGATPLHVAVLFGHSDIVRYLAARFPETTEIADNDGRTALHYAATIKDNGHFFNVLLQLGADAMAQDKLGHTAEFYLDKEQSKDILTYTELLNMFGAEELENQLLNDQGQAENVSFQDNPIFKTEQGKYLADSLADPLIKALTEIANKRPNDPVAYLTGYLQNFIYERRPITEAQVHSGSSKTSSTALVNTNSPPNTDAIELDTQSLTEEEDTLMQHMEQRDEHGQSMLHFACARSHRRGALYNLIEESRIDVTFRDELYRTARDVALQANQPSNATEIDRYILAQAVVGDVQVFEKLALQGYDHILDIEDDNGQSIINVVVERENHALAKFLRNLRSKEEMREELHQMIRENNMDRIRAICETPNAKWLIKTKNYYGRTALHIAVLKESEEIVQQLVQVSPEALRVTDNLERTVLHYAMGTNALESLTHILIKNGAKRTAKDLKGRQASYYFMNKADILRLQEEEEESR